MDHLRITDMSDREFLLVVDETGEDDNWAQSIDVAKALELKDNGNRLVASRLSWMVRYGAVERELRRDEHGNIRVTRHGQPMYTQRWRLTDMGRAMAYGRLKAAQERALEGIADDGMLLAMRSIARRAAGDGTMGRLVRREWQHQIAQR
jgi:hypothetical protein